MPDPLMAQEPRTENAQWSSDEVDAAQQVKASAPIGCSMV